MTLVQTRIGQREYQADTDRVLDVSIPLRFDGPQPNHFGALPATAQPMRVGNFTGDTRQGGSCNAESYTLNPHCNGTHTECVGHITEERISLRDLATNLLIAAALVTVMPVASADTGEETAPPADAEDVLITRTALTAALGRLGEPTPGALVVRTLPNDRSKLQRRYQDAREVPYLTLDAARYICELEIQHLLVDLPSLDRLHDAGLLSAHRVFWGLQTGRAFADAERPHGTVTELIYVPDSITDGYYLLNLQMAPFDTDAAPSRPLLYPLRPA